MSHDLTVSAAAIIVALLITCARGPSRRVDEAEEDMLG
jgi:hypothetical protein